MTWGNDRIASREADEKVDYDRRFMTTKTEHECIDLECPHFDGDMCMRGDCDEDS